MIMYYTYLVTKFFSVNFIMKKFGNIPLKENIVVFKVSVVSCN